MEYFHFNDGYGTPEREHSPLRSRQSSPVSAVEYEFFIEHETNRTIVLRCIEDEEVDLTKESTGSKAVYKANLMKAQKENARNKSKLDRLELEYQRTLDFQEEADSMLSSMLSSMEEEHATEQEMLQCQILNLKLLKDYFLKDKEWKERTTNNVKDASYFVTNLFADDMTKKEATILRHRLEHIQYLYARAITSHRKSSDEKIALQAARMKSEAIEKFNRLNGIEAI
jgi:hypothetical protein